MPDFEYLGGIVPYVVEATCIERFTCAYGAACGCDEEITNVKSFIGEAEARADITEASNCLKMLLP